MATDNFYGMLCLTGGRPAVEAPINVYPDLHLNLWEQIGQEVSLDVGILISKDFPFPDIFFYLPWSNTANQVTDLTSRINSANAIAAIFNESWSIAQDTRSSSITVLDPTSKKVQFQVLSPAPYLLIDEENESSHRVHLEFGRLVGTERLTADKLYLRFRVPNVPKHFYSTGLAQGDRGLVSSWVKDEFIDFRLNVRRGAPPDLETKIGRFLSFNKVHLFLMRHRSNELVFQDTAFRSCRSLEDEHFWARYSHPRENPESDEVKQARTHVVNSLGYQWSKRSANADFVHEFSILARFKRIELSIWLFLVIAVLIGAAGNALWTFLVWVWAAVFSTP